MMRRLGRLFGRLGADERGYVLPMVTVALPVIFGMAGIGVDYSYVVYVQSKLQASSDQAALAAAQGLADGTYTAKANLYSSSASAGGINTINGITVGTPTVATKCSTTLSNAGVACVGSSPGYNAVSVTQSATVPLFFGIAVHFAQMTVTASSYASGGGGFSALNVAIILDTTQSMNSTDSACSMTRLQCAETGVRSILGQLYPSLDAVGLLVFPGVTTTTASIDYGCGGTASSTNPTVVQYGNSNFSGSSPTYTYGIVSIATCTLGSSGNCYKTSNSATTLNYGSGGASSGNRIVQAVGTSNSNACLKAPGGEGTFYADAITAAQAQLAAYKTGLGTNGANTQNVIILLSDGDATASYSNGQIIQSKSTGECAAAIKAAKTAAAAGTMVYSIAYGSTTSGGCSTDTSPAITPYCTMLNIASKPQFFFSDVAAQSCTKYSLSGQSLVGGGSTTGPAPTANISTALKNAGATLGAPRLIPQSMYNQS